MMMAKTNKHPGVYYDNLLERAGESEESGSSGRFDAEITASEDSSAPMRKCISLNSKDGDVYGVPMQVLPLSKMLPYERKDLKHRLRMELEQIQVLKKKVELQRTNGVTVSSSSDILSCNNGQNGLHIGNLRKSSASKGKHANPTGSKAGWNRSSSGRFEPQNQNSAPGTMNVLLLKQCETLLKRLMSHQYSWVFNTPVDVVKLNIPDYLNVIKHPMDLGTVKSKIESGCYSSPLEFLADVRLTFTNAMTYNPPNNDVHIMADTLSKFFEVRWKAIEKKLPKGELQLLPEKSGPRENVGKSKPMPPSKKRKVIPAQPEVILAPAKRVMTVEERHNLGRELESLLAEMPLCIIDFLKENSSNGKDSGEDEIEIDIDDLSDDTLFTLRKLLDDYLLEKQKSTSRVEPCEIELLNESGLSNSSMQPCKENEQADVGGNEPSVSSYLPVEMEKDTGHRINSDSSGSCENESHGANALSLVNAPKIPETIGTEAQLDEKTTSGDPLDRNQKESTKWTKAVQSDGGVKPVSDSGLDQVEQASKQKPGSAESDCGEDGDSAPSDRQVSPDKQYRAALLKNRFADTILRAREKTLTQGEKGDPEKLRREREELELQRKKEKARLEAEAKAAEDARRRAEAEAVAEAKRKRELEREAARQALLQIEKTVEINENSRFLEDLEMLRTTSAEQIPSSVDETSPDHLQDGLGSFKFGGSNPLEQLGLYMKVDEDEEEGEPSSLPNAIDDIEEGEID